MNNVIIKNLVVWSVIWFTMIVNAMTNPATTKCIQDGWISSIINDDSGNQMSVCTFPNGFICDEWAYFNGTCIITWLTVIPWSDRDAHGCIGSAGYIRSDSLKQCVRPWEETDQIVGNDKDKHGCIGSAWYSWSQSKNECVKVWEYQATALEKAYDLAYNNGITTMKSLQKFRANDTITRQEAAKMFVKMAENVFNKKYASYPDECNKTYTDEKMFDSTLKNDIYGSCAHGIMKGSKWYFMPNDQLTKWQTLAIMMRTIDWWQDSEATAQPRWMPYADKAQKLWYMTSLNTKDGESYITRSDVITWMHTFYEASLTK
jgi:hypothetical protein